MIKRISKYFVVAFIVAILTLSLSSYAGRNNFASLINTPEEQDYFQLFKKIIEITKQNYVEEVKDKDLFYSAFDGMLRSLDPHSGFLNNENFKEMHVQTSGQFGGVGIEITMYKGFLKVVSPIDDTPAFKAGIKPSDYITMIDGESVRDLNINQAVQKIRGPKGTKVKLTIVREGVTEPLEFNVERAIIKIVSVKSKILANDVAYFRITSFSQNTTSSLESQIKKILAKSENNLKGIVLDLRNNPGGLLDQAIGVSELFLDGGVVVSTKGRARNAEEIFNAAKGDIVKDIPIVVLINQGSASASEIVAGALQDHKRAVILGKNSFGKGSVQTVVPLGNNLGMRLTTSKYYTPNGDSIQAKGIIPDVEITQKNIQIGEENNKYISESNLPGHLESQKEDLGNDDDAKKISQEELNKIYREDYQLARAIDLLHALSVLNK
jgi:carboxyl-terminal processing protease